MVAGEPRNGPKFVKTETKQLAPKPISVYIRHVSQEKFNCIKVVSANKDSYCYAVKGGKVKAEGEERERAKDTFMKLPMKVMKIKWVTLMYGSPPPDPSSRPVHR